MVTAWQKEYSRSGALPVSGPSLKKLAAAVSCLLGCLLLGSSHHVVRELIWPLRVSQGEELPAMWLSHLGSGSSSPSPAVQLTSGRADMNCSHGALTNGKFVSKRNDRCFKLLSFEVVHYVEIAGILPLKVSWLCVLLWPIKYRWNNVPVQTTNLYLKGIGRFWSILVLCLWSLPEDERHDQLLVAPAILPPEM